MTDDPKRRALDQPIRPTRAEVNLDALTHNLAAVSRLCPRAGILAVVKANAYGHGAVPVARVLESRVQFLGVALVEEGMELRNAGIRAPILVMGGSYDGGYERLVENDLVATVFRSDHLEGLAAAAAALGRRVKVHVKVDTGMGRIGLLPDEVDSFLERAKGFPQVLVDGLLSHFANADLADEAVTSGQIRSFREVLARFRANGFDPAFRHLANSAAVLQRPEVRDGLELNLVRPGIMLYGLSPALEFAADRPLVPVLSWKTAITHLKRVSAGAAVSYGGTWVARRQSLIATLPVGYADGYSRKYSNRASVLIRGRRAPIAGRVCMDMCMADVTEIPDAAVGDEVVLLGRQGSEEVSAWELSRLSETIHYEVLCAVGSRVPRI